ncbi:MAG: hypothetical protein SOR92_07810 [Christensenella hongkongensis]|uniref:hypothetical protein n=1 Tax=Christensenella hongkongensis TaxID=270498 RepID=UPI0007404188|nr:hypothetical protein [Christensenella hongkongensis]KUJ31118.1 hypothetical protein AR437_05540 [Christensenella hongkongensis]MDY3004360.1 hypothetical protein [Christensenella hongkongensis]
MRIKKEASEIWKEYERGISYNTGINLYDNVERNNNFFNDKQWEGVNAPDLDKPVFNFLKPVVNYYTAMLISDDIATNVELANRPGNGDGQKKRGKKGAQADGKNDQKALREQPVGGSTDLQAGTIGEPSLDEKIPKIIAQEVDNIIERSNMKFKNRKMIRNCAVDGDGCFYIWFDPDAETGFDYKGEIKVDLVDNTNVLFGNPSEGEVQEQPYVLIAYRRLTEEVKDEARMNGMNPDEVVADNESYYVNTEKDRDNDYTTVVLKMWKEKGTVHIIKCTRNAVIKREADTEYKLYPLAWLSWETMKNCYHGISPLTGKIQNQIFVNKLYAMAMMYTTKMAFPKMLYDRTKIAAWDNRIGKAIGVAGNPNEALFANFQSADMSNNVMNMVQSTITQTKEMMGASDAALGNVKPDNTSAIIAVQKAAGMPLDIQRMDFYNFVESCVRIFIEMMRVDYGTRCVTLTDNEGNVTKEEFDFGLLKNYALNLKIDIGQGSYWSELMQVQTLDSMMKNKIIPDALTYLEAVPEGYIKNKNKIVESIRQAQGAAGGMMGAGIDGMPEMPGGQAMGAPPSASGVQGEGAMPNPADMSDEELQAFIADMKGQMGDTEEGTGESPDVKGMSDEELQEFIRENKARMDMGTDGATEAEEADGPPDGSFSAEELMKILEELKTLKPQAAIEAVEKLETTEEQKMWLVSELERQSGKMK